MHTDAPRTQPGTRVAVVIDAPASAPDETSTEPAASGRSVARTAVGIATWVVLALAVAVLATVALGPRLGLFQVETVLSGSMEPRFEPGDLLIVVPEPLSDVGAGQVLSFHAPTPDHRVETHRVVRVIKNPNREASHPQRVALGLPNVPRSLRDRWNAGKPLIVSARWVVPA